MLDEIELGAVALPDDHGVFKCFPGEGYKFYDVVAHESVVFLDVRGLDRLPENPAIWNQAELELVVEQDHVLRSLPKRGARGQRRRKSGVAKRNVNFVNGLLLTVKRGDIIVVPPPGYRRDVLIGEVVDDPGVPARVEAQDGDNTHVYLGRRVRWLANVEKRFLRRALLDKLHTAQAFFAIGETLHEDVYRIAYQNYIWRGSFVATFETTKQRFTSADNLVASVWFNGLAATRYAVENKTILTPASFVEVALLPIGEPENSELELNINSPGTMLVRSASAFALALMALLPLSAEEAEAVANGQTRITLRAVGGADPNCALIVESAVADYVRSLGPERLLEQCEFGAKARNMATLKSRVRLKRTP